MSKISDRKMLKALIELQMEYEKRYGEKSGLILSTIEKMVKEKQKKSPVTSKGF